MKVRFTTGGKGEERDGKQRVISPDKEEMKEGRGQECFTRRDHPIQLPPTSCLLPLSGRIKPDLPSDLSRLNERDELGRSEGAKTKRNGG